jgi:hypothetical protein
MSIALETIRGAAISDAWLGTVVAASDSPGRDRGLFHLVTRIDDPCQEQPQIRAAADGLLRTLGFDPIETVANTIFPAQMASASRDHVHLAERYRGSYETIRRMHPANRHGTYFGRLVKYPSAGGDRDQLADLIRRLHTELGTRGPKSARYEVNVSAPGNPPIQDQPGHLLSASVPVYADGEDTSAMGFPCLSFCSFQLDHGSLHMVAHYRSQYLIQRGYGNYLGLGRLLGYVCDATGLRPGQLIVVAAAVTVDARKYQIAQLVRAAAGLGSEP